MKKKKKQGILLKKTASRGFPSGFFGKYKKGKSK